MEESNEYERQMQLGSVMLERRRELYKMLEQETIDKSEETRYMSNISTQLIAWK